MCCSSSCGRHPGDADPTLVFDADFGAKWQRALEKLGGSLSRRFDPASFSHQTGRA